MKKVYPLIAFVVSFILVCCIGKREIHPDLLRMEVFVQDYPDSVLTQLNNYPINEIPDRYNRVYYYLLLTEARDKNQESLLPLDSLLDICIKELNEKRDKKLLAKANIYKAKIWNELKEPKQAVEYYHKALDILNNTSYYDVFTKIYNEMGNIYIDQDLIDDALTMFYFAYNSSKKSIYPENICIPARNIGMTYLFLEQPDSALIYFDRALENGKFLSDSASLINTIYNDLNIYYRQRGNYQKALEYLNKISLMKDKYYLSKGIVFDLMEEKDSAKHYLSLALNTNDIWVRTASYNQLYHLAKKQDQYKDAISYLYQYQKGLDSISGFTHTTDLSIIDHKYNTRLAVANLTTVHRVRVTLLITSFILIIIIITAVVTVKNQRRKLNQRKREQEILKKESEISKLMYQITTTRNTILKLQQRENNEIVNLQKEISLKEEELIYLQYRIDDLRNNFITIHPVYKQIMLLVDKTERENNKVLSSVKREELKKIINTVYVDFIQELQILCPSLTEDDIFFCCLNKMNLPIEVVRICAGYLQTGSARQRKFRIKKKMTEETNNIDLYNSIFSILISCIVLR